MTTFKSKSLFSIFFLMLSFGLTAQLSLGLRTNVRTASNFESTQDFFDPVTGSAQSLSVISNSGGLSYGLGLYSEMDYLWFMGEALVRQTSTTYMVNDLTKLERADDEITENYTQISLPISAGYKKGNFKLGLGPVFHYNLERSTNLASVTGFVPVQKKFDKGFQFTLGYIFKDHFHIELRRDIGFDAVGDDYQFVSKDIKLKSRPNSWSLSFGIFLF